MLMAAGHKVEARVVNGGGRAGAVASPSKARKLLGSPARSGVLSSLQGAQQACTHELCDKEEAGRGPGCLNQTSEYQEQADAP